MNTPNFKKKTWSMLVLLFTVIISENSFSLTLQSVYHNMGSVMAMMARIISSVALIAGISFIVSAFFKFHQHKQNPTQVTVGQGIVLLLIGAALTIFPTLIPTFESVLTGTTGSTASIWGTGIANIIGA